MRNTLRWTPRLLALALLASPASGWAQDDEEDPADLKSYIVEPAEEEEPNYNQRTIEFLWMDSGRLWTDRFRGRVYPREPEQGGYARLTLQIKRYRDGRRRGSPEPLKVEIHVRREDGGDSEVYTLEKPGTSLSQRHTFNRRGRYVVSFVTYYAENETYTVAVRFSVTAPEE